MRHQVPAIVVAALFAFLVSGLFYTQVIRYGYYAHLSKNNSIRLVPIDGPRGGIYDRNGVPIVTNELAFDAALVYDELRDRGRLAKLLGEVLGMSKREIIDALAAAGVKPYVPVTIAEDIGKDRALVLEEATIDTPGLVIQTRSRRSYPDAHVASHVIGYLSQVTEPELDDLRDYGYRARDLLGRDGLEKYYETYLKGVDGGTQVEVDSRGRQVRVLGVKEPAAGRDLRLTIDLPLQVACDTLLGDRRGAVVAIDPRTGEVLALASHPAYDPGVFIRPDETDQRLSLLCDRAGRPMSNRAISGVYAPGSVFKIVTAAAALESKAIDQGTVFTCGGSYRAGQSAFDCWKAGGHGPQMITEAIMHSCNVFFYNAGRRAGADALETYARAFGYGRATGIDLPDEVKGFVPGRAWKSMAKKEEWYEGDTLNMSIGQGYLLVTPLQVVNMTSVIANGGDLERPFIVKQIGRAEIMPGKPRHLGLRQRTVRLIREGMRDAVNAETGTAKRAKLDGVTVAGKTGTAQNPQGRTHAWFTGFAPYDDPRVAIVVFIEHGGKGGLEPAEIAHGVFEQARKSGLL